jgi:hypothetical protein
MIWIRVRNKLRVQRFILQEIFEERLVVASRMEREKFPVQDPPR